MIIRFIGLNGFAIYLGIGALLHAIFHSAHFDWSSAWTWGWLLGWPVMLFIGFLYVMLWLTAIAGVVVIGLIIAEGETVTRWRNARAMKRAARNGGIR